MRANTEPYRIFARTLKSGKIVYYYRYRYDNGSRSPSYSCNTSDPVIAEKYCHKLYLQGKFSQISNIPFRTYTAHFFDDDSDYVKWKRTGEEGITDSTIRTYKIKLKYQILPYFENYSITKITVTDVKNWVIWASDKWSPKTVNNAQGVLSIITKKAKEDGLIQHDPTEDVDYRKVQKIHRILLTPEEIGTIYRMSWISEQQRLAYITAAVTGMRIGEIVALTKDDLHDDYIDVTKSFSREFGTGDTKTHMRRYVPIPKELHDMLEKSIDPETGLIFRFRKTDRPVAEHCVYNSFTRKCDKIEIDRKGRRIDIHTFRNAFISYMRKENVGDAKIRAAVGHKDDSMTDVYTSWNKDMLSEVYEAQHKYFLEIMAVREQTAIKS